MKFKIFTLSLLVTSSVYANDFQGTSTSHGSVLIERHVEHGVDLPAYLRNPSTESAGTSATANPSTGSHTNNTTASGNVNIVNNKSNATQLYEVDEYMCIQNTNCTHIGSAYQIVPGGSQMSRGVIFTTAYLSVPGHYEDECGVAVSGFESSSAKGVNSVTIT